MSSAAPLSEEPDVNGEPLLEQVLSYENLNQALKRVRANRGAPGIDDMTVDQLSEYLAEHLPEVLEALLAGTYRPLPVRRVEIPKPDGGVRLLGIPTALDRFIQQALAQVLGTIFDPHFSDASYGFRPGWSAHQAVKTAQTLIQEGREWVVDIDLAQFFDRVCHDVLLARVARRVKDKRVLKLIRRYLESGVMLNGVKVRTDEGTPQGGPLSPVLSNILLDDLDKELEKRGHKFVRYADDCNIYVGSRRAGERVMESVTRFLETRLRLKVNEAKSAVDRPTNRKFLSFSFFRNRAGRYVIRVAPKAIERVKAQIRCRTRRRGSSTLAERIDHLNVYLRGWLGYFRLAATPWSFQDLDKWVRRRLRAILWWRWKVPKARRRNLVRLGIRPDRAREAAGSRVGPWKMAAAPQLHIALSNAYWREQGLVSLAEEYQKRAI